MKSSLFALAIVAVAVTAFDVRADIITQWNFNSVVPDASTTTGTLTPSIGSGVASNIGGTTALTGPTFFATGSPGDPASSGTDNTGFGFTGFPTQSTASGTAGAQFTGSTLGFTGIEIKFDFRQSSTIARNFQLQATFDGTNYSNVSGGTASFPGPVNNNTGTSFTNGGLYTNNTTGTQTFNQNLTYVFAPGSAFENNANFGFRFVSVFDPLSGGTSYISSNAGTAAAYSTAGTVRFDMVTISGASATAAVPEPTSLLLAGVVFGGAALHRRLRRPAFNAVNA